MVSFSGSLIPVSRVSELSSCFLYTSVSSVSPDQSEISIVLCQPIRRENDFISTNQMSIALCQPIGRENDFVSTNQISIYPGGRQLPQQCLQCSRPSATSPLRRNTRLVWPGWWAEQADLTRSIRTCRDHWSHWWRHCASLQQRSWLSSFHPEPSPAWPIREEYFLVSTNQRKSILCCRPIRDENFKWQPIRD